MKVAVIDIGKTNAKLALVDLGALVEIAVITRPNRVLPGPPYPHFDVEALWRFIVDGLRQIHAAHGIEAISVTTHGACAALLLADGTLAAPVLDYEFTGTQALAPAYDSLRPDFAVTGSPRLPGGLNLGAQLHWQMVSDPSLRDRIATVVPWPQYWSHRLTGIASSDVSSLGCHTDLWEPQGGTFSPLVGRLGLAGRIAPPRQAVGVLGPLLPSVAAATGLDPATPVTCGIHDSNASLLPHLLGREPPFSVVSSGTWVIVMAVGGRKLALDPERDTLVNVDAFGRPVNSARFMGGREFDLISVGRFAEPAEADMMRVLQHGPWLLPAVAAGSGPFPGRAALWVGGEPPPGSPERSAALSAYLAMMTAECLTLVGHQGPILVEGALARSRSFLGLLAAATGAPVEAAPGVTGTALGAALLLEPGRRPAVSGARVVPLQANTYVRRWVDLLGRGDGAGGGNRTRVSSLEG